MIDLEYTLSSSNLVNIISNLWTCVLELLNIRNLINF